MNTENLQKEFGTLRAQLQELLQHAQEKKDEVSSDMISKLSSHVENLRAHANEHMHQIYNASQTGLNETEKFVRTNPLLSVGIAFGAGCLLSLLLRR